MAVQSESAGQRRTSSAGLATGQFGRVGESTAQTGAGVIRGVVQGQPKIVSHDIEAIVRNPRNTSQTELGRSPRILCRSGVAGRHYPDHRRCLIAQHDVAADAQL